MTGTIGRPSGLRVLAYALAALTVADVAGTSIGGFLQGESLIDDLPFVLLLAVTLAVGLLLAVRLPRHPVGWILMAVPALFTLSTPLSLLGQAVRPTAPGVSQWIDWYDGTDAIPSWSWLPPVWLLLMQLPLRFPDGRLPSPRWRWFSRFTVLLLVAGATLIGSGSPTIDGKEPNPAYLPAIARLVGDGAERSGVFPVLMGLFAGCVVVSIASLFVRYRSGAERERAQLRWMMWAVALAVTGLLVTYFAPGWVGWVGSWELALYALIPVAVAIAVLRYRLYEIDRIISRTASYALVTLAVVGTYAAVVFSAGVLLPGLPNLGVTIATLAAALVFLPLLRGTRRIIDRVFNRAQYDAERVADAFGEHLRHGADPHGTGDQLLRAVEDILEPNAIGLWSREPGA